MKPYFVRRRLMHSLVFGWLFLGLNLTTSAQNPALDKLLRPLPDTTNIVAVVRVEEIMKSPRAKAEKWSENPDQNFLAGADTIPTWVELLVVGIHVHPGVIDDVTTVAVVPLPEGVGLDQIASREARITGQSDVEIETLAGHSVIMSSRGVYFAELEKGVVGAMRPGVRQDVSRWIRQLEGRSTTLLAEYLQAAAQSPAHIVLAMDLQDLPEPQTVRDRVALYLPAKSPLSRIDQLAKLIVGIRGVTLRISIQERSPSEIQIDFSQKVEGQTQHVVKLFQEILSEHGLALEELENTKVESHDNSVVMKFDMTDESLRLVLSLLAGPRPGEIGNAPKTTPSRLKVDLAASRKYWTSVNKSLDDLERVQKRAKSVGQIAGWHDSHAKKIENLAIEGVEPTLVDYGLDVSSKLRTLALSLRGVAVEIDSEGRTLTYDVQGDPGYVETGGGWGYGGSFGYRPPTVRVNSNLQQVRERQAAAIQKGEAQRTEIWNMIREIRTNMEKDLRKKYGVDF
ncbi:MAG: hypothetical protein ACKVT0_01725 [Planctomycetaceae bacterium]